MAGSVADLGGGSVSGPGAPGRFHRDSPLSPLDLMLLWCGVVPWAPSGIRLHAREDPGLSVCAGDGVLGHLMARPRP